LLRIMQSLKSEMTVIRNLTATRNLTVTRTKKLIFKLLISSPNTGQTTSPLSWINFQCKLRKLNKSQKQCCTLKSIELCFVIGSKFYSWVPTRSDLCFFKPIALTKNLVLEVFVIYLVLAPSRQR
jgi:hypothetical protein